MRRSCSAQERTTPHTVTVPAEVATDNLLASSVALRANAPLMPFVTSRPVGEVISLISGIRT